jgi:hypothetical protein
MRDDVYAGNHNRYLTRKLASSDICSAVELMIILRRLKAIIDPKKEIKITDDNTSKDEGNN